MTEQEMQIEIDNAIAERDNAIAERDNAIAERDNAIAERDQIKQQYEDKFREDGEEEKREKQNAEIGDYFKSII